MDKVRLVKVRSISQESENGWKEEYRVIVKVNNKIIEFKTDLKDGVKSETQKIFDKTKYDYSCFESMYGREPKENKKKQISF